MKFSKALIGTELNNKMKIGIAKVWQGFLPLLVNLALYMKEQGEGVYFIDPTPKTRRVLKKFKIPYSLSKKTNQKIKLDEETKRQIRANAGYLRGLDVGSKKIINKLEKDYVKKYFLLKKEKFDVIFFYNGHLNIEPLVAKNLNIKSVFIEHGCFANHIQIDMKGVGRNASHANLNYKQFLKYKGYAKPLRGKKDFKIRDVKTPFLSGLSNLFILFENPRDFFKATKWAKKGLKILLKNKLNPMDSKMKKIPENFIFIPLQDTTDTQIFFHSPIIKHMGDILDFFYKDIKELLPDYKIIIKEHPGEQGRVDYDPWKKKYPDTIWLKNYDFNALLDKSKYVITINSSSGLQALDQGKKVLILGECFYQNNPFVEKIKTKKEFKNKLKKLKNKNLNKVQVKKYTSHFKNDIFIKGSYKKLQVITLQQIYSFIKNLIKDK